MSFIIDLEKAADPTTSPALLSEMWHAPIDNLFEARAMRSRIVANPNISPKLAQEMVQWGAYQDALLKNPVLPLWLIEGMAGWTELHLRRLLYAACVHHSSLYATIRATYVTKYGQKWFIASWDNDCFVLPPVAQEPEGDDDAIR